MCSPFHSLHSTPPARVFSCARRVVWQPWSPDSDVIGLRLEPRQEHVHAAQLVRTDNPLFDKVMMAFATVVDEVKQLERTVWTEIACVCVCVWRRVLFATNSLEICDCPRFRPFSSVAQAESTFYGALTMFGRPPSFEDDAAAPGSSASSSSAAGGAAAPGEPSSNALDATVDATFVAAAANAYAAPEVAIGQVCVVRGYL